MPGVFRRFDFRDTPGISLFYFQSRQFKQATLHRFFIDTLYNTLQRKMYNQVGNSRCREEMI